MMTLILLLAIVFVLAPLAQAYARRLDPPEVPGVPPGEIARLREELDMLSAQVNRLQDEQTFMLRLLSEGRDPPRLERGDSAGERSREQGHNRPDTRT